MTTQANWKERYGETLLRNYYEYCKRNKEAPVKKRLLTQEEYRLIFHEDYNNIKYIEV